MIKGADFSGWPKSNQKPIDITYQLRNFFGAVVSQYTGETRDFYAPTSDLTKAEEAKAALEKAIAETVGEQRASVLGIKVALKKSNTSLFTAYDLEGRRVTFTDGQSASLSPEQAQEIEISKLLKKAEKSGAESVNPKEIEFIVRNPNKLAQRVLGEMLDQYFATDWAALGKERAKYGVYSNGSEATNTDPDKLKPAFAREDVIIKHHTGVSYTVALEVPRGTTLAPVLAKRLFEKFDAYAAKLNGAPETWTGREAAKDELRAADSLQLDGNGELSYSGPAR